MTQMKKGFSGKTILAIVPVIVLLLTYHITRPFWLDCNYSNFIDMSIKLCIDVMILFMAWQGTKQNRKKRNQYLFLILVLYFIGDMITSFSTLPAAIPYAAGHILLIYCIINTCNIKKWQYVLTFFLTLCSIPVILKVSQMLPEMTWLLCIIAFLYGCILIAKFCLSLTNRFFCFAAVFFLIGDTFGFLRITVLTQLTPVIDYTAYVAAILLYGLSIYNCSRKDVVCFGDVAALNKALAKTGIKYFFYGDWSKNLLLHRFLQQSPQIKIMYDVEQAEEFYKALAGLHYQSESCLSGGSKALYCEKWGSLYIKEITTLPDDSIIYRTENGNPYILDSGFVHTLKRGKAIFPCIFPLDENDQALEPFREA